MELTDEEREHIERHFTGSPPERYWYDIDRTIDWEDGELTVAVFRFSKGRGGGFAWVRTPTGEMRCFADQHLLFRRSRQRARLFAELWSRVGKFDTVSKSNFVPVSIAALGKPAIAAYLRSIHYLSDAEIANNLDISKSTVRQYLSHFQEGRR